MLPNRNHRCSGATSVSSDWDRGGGASQDLRLGLLLCVFGRFARRLVFELRAD
jgi:hypothetical protein